jgi:hypothetical protein
VIDEFAQFMRSFASRCRLKKKVRLEFREDADRPRVFCDEPAIAARFASHLRQQAALHFGCGTKVLMRGQNKNFRGMMPALFRPPSNRIDYRLLLKAEERFEKEIRDNINLGRLKRANLAALLQHYGYRTSWLDVMDNLWMAVWFASHSICRRNTLGTATSFKTNGAGWIYFVASELGSQGPCAIDLREVHQGLSLRPHTQHAWSVRLRQDVMPDLNDWVIGCLEFPSDDERWVIEGYMAGEKFLFPAVRIDHTLRILTEKKVDAIAASVEHDLRLPDETLGRLFSFK